MQSRMSSCWALQPPGSLLTSTVLASKEVHKAGASKSSKVGKLCYRCGDGDHVPPKCPFLKATCLGCGKGGHIKRKPALI